MFTTAVVFDKGFLIRRWSMFSLNASSLPGQFNRWSLFYCLWLKDLWRVIIILGQAPCSFLIIILQVYVSLGVQHLLSRHYKSIPDKLFFSTYAEGRRGRYTFGPGKLSLRYLLKVFVILAFLLLFLSRWHRTSQIIVTVYSIDMGECVRALIFCAAWYLVTDKASSEGCFIFFEVLISLIV